MNSEFKKRKREGEERERGKREREGREGGGEEREGSAMNTLQIDSTEEPDRER